MDKSLLREARDVNTPVERLSQLAKSKSSYICKAVALNPNTAPDLLVQLFKKYPLEVLNNISLELILLENPNFLEELHQNNSNALWEKRLPLFYIHWASTHKNELVRTNIAYNHDLPQDILEQLARDTKYTVRYAVARRRNLPNSISTLR